MHPGPAPQPLSASMTRGQVYALLFSLMTTLFVGALDQTVVSVALPRILADLQGFSLLSWLFTSYMLTSTIVIPLVGKLGDLFGRKLFLIGGVFVFMAASAACGAAPNMESLIFFRFVQGLGGGMIFASVFATLGDLFTPAERGKYVGFFTGTFSLASLLGPTLGGFITDNLSWRWIFYINIPVSLVAMVAIWYALPAKPKGASARIDFLGAAWLSAASVAFLMAMVWAGDRYAWASIQIVGLLIVAAVFTALFIAQERRHPEPILPLHLFRNQVFLLSNLVVFTFGLGVFGAFQYIGLFVQTAMGASATASGIVTTPQSIGVLVTSILGGQVLARTGKYKAVTVTGTALIAGAMVLLTMVSAGMPKWQLSMYMVILGLGFGMVLPTMSLIIQNAVPFQFMGVATSSSQFFRQIGAVMGIAIFGVVLTHTYRDELGQRFPPEDVATVAAINPAIPEQLEDPTIRLNEGLWAATRAQILSAPEGEALLERAEDAQAGSVTIAIRHIFWGSLAAAGLSLLFALVMREIPLRRTMGAPQGAPGAAGAPASRPAPRPAPEPGPGGGSGAA